MRVSPVAIPFPQIGVPAYIRSDDGPEFISEAVRQWIRAGWCGDGLHRTGISLGERVLRELQRQVPR